MHQDPVLAFWLPICSLLVAALAIVVAPLVNWLVSKRQMQTALKVAQKQVIAPMRQKWIDALRDRVAEIISTTHWYYLAGADQLNKVPDEVDSDEHAAEQAQIVERKMIFLLNQVDLMLNPKEDDHVELKAALNRLHKAAFGSPVEFPDAVDEANTRCKTVLKREWERLKTEA